MSIYSKVCKATLYFFVLKVLRILFYPPKHPSQAQKLKIELKDNFFWDTLYISKLLCFNVVSDINHKTSFQNNTTWKLLTIINHNHKFNFSLMTKFVIWPINQVNIEEELFATFTRFMRLMKPEVQVNQVSLIILTVSVN